MQEKNNTCMRFIFYFLFLFLFFRGILLLDRKNYQISRGWIKVRGLIRNKDSG
jgi:hypothetical protein